MEITSNTYTDKNYEHFEKHGDKNHFEEIIDLMILEGVVGNNETFSQAIKSLPRDKKRTTILSILDKNLNLFNRIKALNDHGINKMDHIKDIILMLREYVKVGEVEKKKFGEVMTPLDLVKEMIATLPEEVWSNPNLKWLDPANGTGPYPIMVIYKLMNGLKEWEPDDEKRYKHIVENMIYVCELQPKNMFLYLCAVDPFDMYKLNIYTGSFLEQGFDKHMEEVWGLDKFDIVIGNPPYNDSSGNRGRGHSLWPKFTEKSIEIIKEDGYLCFVTPSLWRNAGSEFLPLMKLYQMVYLEIHDEKDGQKLFGASTRYDIYLIKKKRYSEETKIYDQLGKINYVNISNWNFIPNYMFDEISNLIKGENKCEIIYNRSSYAHYANHISKEKTNLFRFPVVYSINKKDDPRILYSSTADRGHFGIPKIIWGSGATGFLKDEFGQYGMTQWCSAIVVDNSEEIDQVIKCFKSEKFNKVIKAISVSKAEINHKILKSFKKDFWKEFI